MDTLKQLEKITQLLEAQQADLHRVMDYCAENSLRNKNDLDEDQLCSGSYFERIAEIVNIKRAARNKMAKVYERDRYTLKNCKDPGNKLTDAQEAEIHAFWQKYEFAYKNDPNIQRYFTGISGKFDPTYIGFGLQYYCLNRYWNHITVALARNKNFLDQIFPQAKMPRTIMRNMWARYYTADRKLITRGEAVEIVFNELQQPGTDSLILKPDDGELGGGITFLEKNASRSDIERAFSFMKEQFICQEVIKNHPTHAAPHPESLNTLRIATLFIRDHVHLVGVVWRMGIDKKVDNWSAGGLACGIREGGLCSPYAEDKHGNRHEYHPSGFKFAGHKLYGYDRAVEKAMELHKNLPQLKYISWDFAVDKVGDPVFIEMNSCGDGDLLQMNGFPCYINRNILEPILDEYLIKRFYYDRANWNWNYQEYSDHVVIVKYCGQSAKATVPNKLRGKPVTNISGNAFAGKKMTLIEIPSSVEKTCKQSVSVISNRFKTIILNE